MSDQGISLRTKILTSAKLSSLQFLSGIGLRLISTVVLTRLLAPEIYGVFAIVMVYMYILEMFSDLGLRSLILTKEGEVDDRFLRTCWTVSALRGCVIALFSCAIAGVIALLQTTSLLAPDSPYMSSDLPLALACVGATTIISSLQNPTICIHERAMEFGRVTVFTIASNVFALIATIGFALVLQSVWALVLGNALRMFVQVPVSFIMFRGPPMRFSLDRTDLALIIGRGKWIIGHSALTAMSLAGDRLLLGFAMSSTTFGFYFIARQLVDVMQSFLNSLHGQMGLQVFTHLQNTSTDSFRRNYYRYRFFFDAAAGLSTGGLIVLSPLVVSILFDDRYRGVADIVQIIVWSVLLIGPLLLRDAFIAERRFKDVTYLGILSTATLWIGLGFSIFVLDSTTLALTVIALYRLPEAMALIIVGGDRDWVIVWREFLGFGFCGLGIVLGLGVLSLWNLFV